MGPLAIPLITAGASLLGGLFQGGMGYRAQERTNRANMEMARYQYRKDLEMWNRGNKYNSPEAQMERLKQAGLNPNLVYGANAPGNASGTLPKYNAPTLDYSYVPPVQDAMTSALNTFQDYQVKQAQINNLREQNKVIRETALQKDFMNQYMPEYLEQRNFGQGMTNYWKNYLYQHKELQENIKASYGEELFKSQLDFAKGRLRYQDAQILNMEKQGRKIDASTDYQNKVNEWYLTKMFSQLGIQAVNSLGKFVPGPKKLPSLNQNKRPARYNSQTSWRELGY